MIVRELRGIDEFAACEALEHAVWGQATRAVTRELLVAVQSEGGLIAGAIDDVGTLAAALFAFPTATPSMQHSHYLGVLPSHRGRGLGEQLKRFQGAWCLERDIHTVRWTYDPLRIANAHLNLTRLGGRAVAYERNVYGVMGGINGDLPSDRIVVDWTPASPAAADPASTSRVELPEDLDVLLGAAHDEALRWRMTVREQLEAALRAPSAIVGFDRATRSYLVDSGAQKRSLRA